MPDQPASKMIRVSTPLIDAVQKLCQLHRQGHTQAILEGLDQLISTVDSRANIKTQTANSDVIAELLQRVEKLEESDSDVIAGLRERLEKVETDINSIALTIADLNVRLSDLEGVGDIGYAVTPLSELSELEDSSSDIETTAPSSGSTESDTDSTAIGKPEPTPAPPSLVPLTQSALARRLGCSDKAVEKHRRQGDKENFAAWSRDRDPDNIAWTWEGAGGRGQRLHFVPAD